MYKTLWTRVFLICVIPGVLPEQLWQIQNQEKPDSEGRSTTCNTSESFTDGNTPDMRYKKWCEMVPSYVK